MRMALLAFCLNLQRLDSAAGGARVRAARNEAVTVQARNALAREEFQAGFARRLHLHAVLRAASLEQIGQARAAAFVEAMRSNAQREALQQRALDASATRVAELEAALAAGALREAGLAVALQAAEVRVGTLGQDLAAGAAREAELRSAIGGGRGGRAAAGRLSSSLPRSMLALCAQRRWCRRAWLTIRATPRCARRSRRA